MKTFSPSRILDMWLPSTSASTLCHVVKSSNGVEYRAPNVETLECDHAVGVVEIFPRSGTPCVLGWVANQARASREANRYFFTLLTSEGNRYPWAYLWQDEREYINNNSELTQSLPLDDHISNTFQKPTSLPQLEDVLASILPSVCLQLLFSRSSPGDHWRPNEPMPNSTRRVLRP